MDTFSSIISSHSPMEIATWVSFGIAVVSLILFFCGLSGGGVWAFRVFALSLVIGTGLLAAVRAEPLLVVMTGILTVVLTFLARFFTGIVSENAERPDLVTLIYGLTGGVVTFASYVGVLVAHH